MPTNPTRRVFLKHTSHTVAAGVAAGVLGPAWARPQGANGDIRLAIVGLNSHGAWDHMRNYLKMPGVRVVALCDPDRNVLDREAIIAREKNPGVRTYTDLRKLLEADDVDAISGATPNHWHALSTIWACQAGKHVCVEKPVSHNIREGRKMVEAAATYRRLVQADLDKRSDPAVAATVAYVQSGDLGRIKAVHSWVYKRRGSIGKVGSAGGSIPASVDYDLWCGPAPKGPLPRKNLHYDWHWQWDTGCGEIGNNGPHHLDVCRWVLGEQGLPSSVLSFGGRYGYDDDGETPNTQVTVFEYPAAPIYFEVRGLPRRTGDQRMDAYRAASFGGLQLQHDHDTSSPNNGEIVVCENGFVNLSQKIVYDLKGKEIRRFTGEGPSAKENFISALRSGRISDLRTTILEGHLSTSLCHMGNISYRVGREASLEQVEDVIRQDAPALDALGRAREHLAANGLDLKSEGLTLGPRLAMDSASERFKGTLADEANKLVKRTYRKPFVVPEQV